MTQTEPNLRTSSRTRGFGHSRISASSAAALTLLLFAAPAEGAGERALRASPFLWFDLAEHLSADVQLGDLDGDGDLDVALANGRHWAEPDFVFLNAGDGKLLEARPLDSSLRPTYSVRLGDLDRDGDLDAVAIHDHLPPKVWLGDGTGDFTSGSPITTGGGRARAALLADLNGDGALDLVVARRRESDLLYLGDGSGGFAPSRPMGDPEGASTAVAAADLDRDGDSDLVFARRDGQPSVVAYNDGKGGFTERPLQDSVADTRRIVAGDFDGDHHVDLALGIVGAANVFYRGDGAGGFVRGATFGAGDGRTYALAATDLDRDGDLDLVEGNDEQPNAVYFNSGDGASFRRVELDGEKEAQTYGVDVGDLDGDGYPEVVFANSENVNEVYLNRPAEPAREPR